MGFSFTFLGTGTSVGVPQIGCRCKVCTSSDPRDRRRRCGAYLRRGDCGILVDTPPEMREGAIACGVDRVDAVVLTHAHMDHIAGFDDVRRFNTLNGETVACRPDDPGANGRTTRVIGKVLNCYALPETITQMHTIFPYVGTAGGANGLYRPQVAFADNSAPFELGGVKVTRFAVDHGFPCCGYLFEADGARLAYASDCHALPDESVDLVRGVDLMVLDCLRERPHPTHLNLEGALALLERIAPKEARLTHLCHDLTHEEWLAKLPPHVRPAYDGERWIAHGADVLV